MTLQQKPKLNPLSEIICLDDRYSTTRRLCSLSSEVVRSEINTEQNQEYQSGSVLFLPEGENRQGEGGLRTQGYFKINCENKPLITVATVVFNGEEHLEETILNIINQEYDNIEYIVIDGGSTDNTIDIIKKYQKVISYWVSEKDGGIYDAMNKCWSLARPDSMIMFIGAGDRIIELPEERELIKNKDRIIYGDACIGDRIFYGHSNWKLRIGNTLHHQALLIPKRIVKKKRPFKIEYNKYADYDLNLYLYLIGSKYYKAKSFKCFALPGGVSASLDRYQMFRVSISRNNRIWSLVVLFFYVVGMAKKMYEQRIKKSII